MPKKMKSFRKQRMSSGRRAVKKLRGGYASAATTPRTGSKPAFVNMPPFGRVYDYTNSNTNSLNALKAKMKKLKPWAAAALATSLSAYVSSGIMADGGMRVLLNSAMELGENTASPTKTSTMLELSSTKARQPGNGAIAPSKIHKVTLETGRRPSKSISKWLEMNGSTMYTLHDTKKMSSYQTNVWNLRDQMQLHGGFNQKLFYMNYYLQTPIQDIFNMYGWSTSTIEGLSRDYSQKFYGIAKNLYETISISNLNSFNAVDVKIHLVLQKQATPDEEPERAYWEPIDKLTYSNLLPGTAATSKLPVHKTIKVAESFTPYFSDASVYLPANKKKNLSYACYTAPAAQANQSQEFQDSFQVIHTIKKRLAPSDTLEFVNKIGLGSGLPLHEMYETFRRTKSAAKNLVGDTDNYVSTPIAYSYVIEVVGQKTVGKAILDSGTEGTTIRNEKFLGTSPYLLQIENKRTIEVANKTHVLNSSDTEGLPADEFPVKVFTTDGLGAHVFVAPFNRDFASNEVKVYSLTDDSLKESATI